MTRHLGSGGKEMEHIDIYCERTGPAFWAEPVNALTNLAFFVAAWALWRLARREGALDAGAGLLILLLVAIGAGSFAFHTLATRPAMLADVIPILLFQLAWLWLYGRRVVGWDRLVTAMMLAGYLALSMLMAGLPPVLNGSLGYLPALVILLAIGAWHARAERPGRHDLLAAGGVLAVSLTLRTVDQAVCPAFPLGTHFLWHLLNGLVLYLAARPVVLARRG